VVTQAEMEVVTLEVEEMLEGVMTRVVASKETWTS
jgi:hypothetical protein